MKKTNYIISFIFVSFLALVLVGCKNKEDSHTHNFNLEIANASTLVSEATCTQGAVYKKSCSCGQVGTETFVEGSALGHSWSTTYNGDGNGHYHTCERCSAHSDNEDHDYTIYTITTAPTLETAGKATYTCEICDYKKENVDVEILSVSEIKEKEVSDTLIFVRGIVIGSVYTGSNPELLIQDEETGDIYGIRNFDDNIIYSKSDSLLLNSTFKKGDLVQIPVKVFESTATGVDYGKVALSSLISNVKKDSNGTALTASECVIEHNKTLKIASEYDSDDITVINSQTTLSNFLLTENKDSVNTDNFYKIVKISGTIIVRNYMASGHTSTIGITFNATDDNSAKILTSTPALRNENFVNILSTSILQTLNLTDPLQEYKNVASNIFKGDIYCVYFGGNSTYYQFMPLGLDDIIYNNAGTYTETETTHTPKTASGKELTDLTENHIWGEETVVAATHTTSGSKTKTCTVCGHVHVETIDKLTAHIAPDENTVYYNESQEGVNKHYYICSCGQKIYGTCSETLSLVTEVESTCKDYGYKIERCTVCGKEYRTDYTTKEEHVLTKHNAKAATETEVGNKEYYTCSNSCCDGLYYVLVEGEYVAKDYDSNINLVKLIHTHTFGEVVSAKAATCTESGNKEYKQCSSCHKYYNADGTEEISDIIIPATGHSYQTVDAKAATCCEVGYTQYQECSACHNKVGYQEISKLSHSYENNLAKQGWYKVTNASDLNRNDKIIIIAKSDDKYYAIANNYDSTNSSSIKATKIELQLDENDNLVIENENVINIFTLGAFERYAGGIQGFYSLKSSLNNRYLSGSTSADSLDSTEECTKNANSWYIAFNETTAVATLTAAGTNTYRYINYSSDNGFYSSTKSYASLYVYKYGVYEQGSYHIATQPTCTNDGTKGYYVCELCNKLYDLENNYIGDIDGTYDQSNFDAASYEALKVNKYGHDYYATWTWNTAWDPVYDVYPYATVKIYCSSCSYEYVLDSATAKVLADYGDASAPTCTQGSEDVTLTVTITIDGVGTFEDTKEVDYEPLGHEYNKTTDGKTVKTREITSMPTISEDDKTNGKYSEECHRCSYKSSNDLVIYDVSDINSTLYSSIGEDTNIIVRAQVVTVADTKNNRELIVKDVNSNASIGIIDVGTSMLGTLGEDIQMGKDGYPLNSGDIIYIPVTLEQLTYENDSAEQHKIVLHSHVGDFSCNWGVYNSTTNQSGIIIEQSATITWSHDDDDVVTIDSQDDLINFLSPATTSGDTTTYTCANSAYKYVKLSTRDFLYFLGYSDSDYADYVRFSFTNPANYTSGTAAGTALKISEKWVPIFSYNNLKFSYSSTDYSKFINSSSVSSKYSSPNTFIGDIYCLFIGGNGAYAVFDIVEPIYNTTPDEKTAVYKSDAVKPYFVSTFTEPTITQYTTSTSTEDDKDNGIYSGLNLTGGKIVYSDYSGTGSFAKGNYTTGIISAASLSKYVTNLEEFTTAIGNKTTGEFTIKLKYAGRSYSYKIEIIDATLSTISHPAYDDGKDYTTVYYNYTTKTLTLSDLIIKNYTVTGTYTSGSSSSTSNISIDSSMISCDNFTADGNGIYTLTITYDDDKTCEWKVKPEVNEYLVEYTGSSGITLTAGMQFVVVNSSKTYAMSKSQSADGSSTALVKSGDDILYSNTYKFLTLENTSGITAQTNRFFVTQNSDSYPYIRAASEEKTYVGGVKKPSSFAVYYSFNFEFVNSYLKISSKTTSETYPYKFFYYDSTNNHFELVTSSSYSDGTISMYIVYKHVN